MTRIFQNSNEPDNEPDVFEQVAEEMKRQNAVSILRVSTTKQFRDGEGINDQRLEKDSYIKRQGYNEIREFEIAESADRTDDGKERDEFTDALAYCTNRKNEIDVVVIARVDRLSRGGLAEYYGFKSILNSRGIRLESATERIDDTPSGEALEGMLAVVARYDNRVRSKNTDNAEKILTNEGYWCREAPTGFVNAKVELVNGERKKPTLRPDPDKKQWELLCYGLRKQMTGIHKPTVIARELHDKGLLMRETTVPRKKGEPRSKKRIRVRNLVSPQSWTKLCRNPVMGGMMREKRTKGKLIRAEWERYAPLKPEEWQTLQDVLDRKGNKALRQRRHKLNPDVPLRRFLKCPHCDNLLRGYGCTGKMKNKRYFYYDCGNPACPYKAQFKTAYSLDATKVHPKFLEYLQRVKPTEKLLNLFDVLVTHEWEQAYGEIFRETNELNEKANALRAERKDVLDLMKINKNNPEMLEVLQEDFDHITAEIKVATLRRNAKELEEHDVATVVAHCRHYMENTSELWDSAPVEAKGQFQELIFPHGVSPDVFEDKRTPEFSLIYRAIEKMKIAENDVAAPRGVEPRLTD